MKAGTTESMKFMVLKSRLRLPKYAIVGLLESLWNLTARSAVRGDIGRFSDIEIAAWLEWDGDASQLIDALVESRFLDRDKTHRLIVHDWHEHASTYIKGNIHHQGGFIVPNGSPNDKPIEPPKDDPKDDPKDTPTKPSLAKPSQSNPTEGGASGETPASPPERPPKNPISLALYLESVPDNEPIPNDHAVFRWAKEVGLPDAFLSLAWDEFEERMRNNGKRQKDWPKTFQNYVRLNYLHLWYLDGHEYKLTTTGLQTQRMRSSHG